MNGLAPLGRPVMQQYGHRADRAWPDAARRWTRRLPILVSRHALRPDDAAWIPVPREISAIARDRRQLPNHQQPYVNPHKYVLLVTLDGRGTVCLGDRRLRLAPGDTLLIFPHQAHRFMDLEADALHWVFIAFRLEGSEAILRPLRNRPRPAPPGVRAGLAPFLAAVLACASDDPGRRRATAARLWLMLMELVESVRPARQGVSDATPSLRHMPLVERLDGYIAEHLGEPLTVRGWRGTYTCRRVALPGGSAMSWASRWAVTSAAGACTGPSSPG